MLLKNNNTNHRMGGKLESKCIGPYEVVSLQGKGRAKLKNLSTSKKLKNAYHMVNLKLYRLDDASGDGQDQDNYQDKEYT